MNYARKIVLLLFATTTLCSLGIQLHAAGIKYKTSGVYIDSTGGQAPWSINDAHTLIWKNEPYVPVGFIFTSKYSADPTDENLQADETIIKNLKSSGIEDLILKSTKPISQTDPEALQKIIDLLEENGLRYGIELNDGPKEGLSGYIVSPNLYRLEGPVNETVIEKQWPDVNSAIYFVMNKFDNTIAEKGGAFSKDGKITFNLDNPISADQILIAYPHKSFKPADEGGISDIWSGFGEYRDRTIAFFKKIKMGKGLRFFIEPFSSKMDFTANMVNFVPESSGFRLGFEAYLTKKYVHEGALSVGWGLNEGVDSIEEATTILPLWSMGRGIRYTYGISNGQMHLVDVGASQYWRDMLDYRDFSAQECMNNIANILKSQVANVPVIFIGSSFNRIYTSPYGVGGFDGIGVEAYGTGDNAATQSGGAAYSLAEQSAKTMWFITAKTQAGANTSYTEESSMSGALDSLREVGSKGFFIENSSDPKQISMLNSVSANIKKNATENYKPTVIDYPIYPLTGAYTKRLMPNTWWLPTLRIGKTNYIGDGLQAYTILGEDRSYLWSDLGTVSLTFKAGISGMPSVVFPAGASISKRKMKNNYGLTLTNTPTVLSGADFEMLFPSETAQSEIDRLAKLIPEADKTKLDVSKARESLVRARSVMKNDQALRAYGMSQDAINELKSVMGTDLWIEGESSQSNNFDAVKPISGTSRGLALIIDTDQEPPLAPYTASYIFDASSSSSYEVWLAGTIDSDRSDISYNIDSAGWNTLVKDVKPVDTYAPGLGWQKIGTTNFGPGKHTIKLRLDSRRPKDGKYYMAIDAIVISPFGFKPDGIRKP